MSVYKARLNQRKPDQAKDVSGSQPADAASDLELFQNAGSPPDNQPKPKHAGGRPTKYRPEYAEHIVRFCAQGFSLTAFAGSIGSWYDQIMDWAAVNEEFALACKRAKSASTYWWENKAQAIASRGGSGGQTAMCIFMLKNHAPHEFRERMELTGKDGGALALELLLNKLDEPKTIEHQPADADVSRETSITSKDKE